MVIGCRSDNSAWGGENKFSTGPEISALPDAQRAVVLRASGCLLCEMLKVSSERNYSSESLCLIALNLRLLDEMAAYEQYLADWRVAGSILEIGDLEKADQQKTIHLASLLRSVHPRGRIL